MDATGVAVLILAMLVFATVAALVLGDVQAVVAFLSQQILEPTVRWVQRVLFGIDRVRAGPESLIGLEAIAGEFEASGDGVFTGWVMAEGERWFACSAKPISAGAAVSITDRRDLELVVTPVEAD